MRRVWFLALFMGILCFAFGQGEPHSIVGQAENSDHTPIPEGCGRFVAYPYPSASDTVTQDSDGCGFSGSDWWVQIADFELEDGDTVAIRLENSCNGETLLVLVEVDLSVPVQDVGLVTLVPGAPVVTVLYPNGGESFEFGDPIVIRWTASPGIAAVNVLFSSDGGAGWDTVALGVDASSGEYSWTAPSVGSDECLVKVEDASDPAVYDVSDGFFSIAPAPFVDLTSPAGGEHYYVGDTVTISWSGGGISGVDLFFSSDGGATWAFVDSGLPPSASYYWTAPDVVSDSCIIRAWATDDTTVVDYSGIFSIDTLPAVDSIPPDPVVDLAADSVTYTAVLLSWTLTGDDGVVGTPSSVDLRYSTSYITELGWPYCTPVSGLPPVDTAGTRQSVWVDGLLPGQTYFFAMKVCDEVPNCSDLSNVVEVTLPTPPDTTPPGAFELSVSEVGCDRATISWVAPGDDGDEGTADHYEFRYADFELTAENFDSGEVVSDVPEPQPAGTEQSIVIFGLAASTHYWVAAYAYDEEGNRSPLAVVDFTTGVCADTIPPAAITTLTCSDFKPTGIQLEWMAPGDDFFSGTAAAYEVRYSTEPFDEETWVYADSYALAMLPSPAGTLEHAWVEGLEPATTYYFAVFAFDEAGNRSHPGIVVDCVTMGVSSPVADVYTTEDASDMFLADLADVFVPGGLDYSIASGEGVTAYLPDSEGTEVWLSLEPDYNGETFVILYASHLGYIVADTVLVHVAPVNDAPRFTCGVPESVAVPGVDFDFVFTAEDVDGDSIWFVLAEGAPGMSLAPTGSLHWIPPATEGHYDVTVFVTDGVDTAYLGFPVRVYKLTDSIFAPRNLVAHSGYLGAIPLTWDVPEAVILGFPVHLVGYQVYRSAYPDSEPVFIASSDVNVYNDASVTCGYVEYYRVKAVYDEPSFVSAYSNTDGGACDYTSDRIYSSWTLEPVLVDGSIDDEAWSSATVFQLEDGYTLGFVNTASYLYGFVEFTSAPEDSLEFSFWFDDDNSGFWDGIPSDEGRIFFRFGDTVRAYFQPVANVGGVAARGTPTPMSQATSAWAIVGSHAVLEYAIPLGDDQHFGCLPGDSSGVMFEAESPSVGVLFRWLPTSDELAPATYGRLILGSPSGVPSIIVAPLEFEVELEQGTWTQVTTYAQNMGEGTGFIALSSAPGWISVSPEEEFLYPGVATPINVVISADMEPGDYIGYVNFYTTDPVEPLRQVEVILHVTPVEPENHLIISLPEVVYASADSDVVVPVEVGELYDNLITRVRFTVLCDPDVVLPVGAFAGGVLPGDWSVDVTSAGEDHITVDVHGIEPLPAPGEIVKLRFSVSPSAFRGAASPLEFSEPVVNDGFPYPTTQNGLLVVGEDVVPYWSAMVTLVLPGGVRADSASFGVHPLGTDGYDLAIDRLDPPALPDGANVFFLASDYYHLQRDIRSAEDTVVTFPLVTEQAGYIEWDVNRVWSGCYVGDTLDMKTVSSVAVSAGDTVVIYYHRSVPFRFVVHLLRGWNMVSIPIAGDAFELSEVFPDAIPPAYYYDPEAETYVPTTTLEPGKGYWVLINEDHDYELSGEPLLRYELELPPGWYMIGAPAEAVYWSEQSIEPPDAFLEGTLFGHITSPPSYYVADVLVPGEAFWVLLLRSCTVSVSAIYSH